MDIKLIPKEYKQGKEIITEYKIPFTDKPVQSKLFIKILEKINLWLGLSIILLIVSIVASVSFYGWGIYLKGQIDQADQQITSLNKQRDLDLEERIKDLGKAIEMLKKLLANHVYPTKLFALLEQLTIGKVQLTSFDANLSESTVNLAGLTDSWLTLAQQMKAFSLDKRIIKLDTSNFVLSNSGQVQFNMNLEIDPQFLRYQMSN